MKSATNKHAIRNSSFFFIGYGLLALVGVFIVLLVTGPLHKDEALYAYVASGEEENRNEHSGNEK